MNGEPSSSTHPPAQVPDRITHFKLSKRGFSEKCAEFRASGLSLKQIAKELGVAKSTVRRMLANASVAARGAKGGRKSAPKLTAIRRAGASPFGFCYLRGKLVVDPKETETLHLILRLWRSGKSLSDIARHLDHQRIKTRRGGRWKPATIRAIVLRHEKTNPTN